MKADRRFPRRIDALEQLFDFTAQVLPDALVSPALRRSVDFVLEGLYAQRKISRSLEGQFQAAEQVKRAPRTVDQLTDRELPLSGSKKKYYN